MKPRLEHSREPAHAAALDPRRIGPEFVKHPEVAAAAAAVSGIRGRDLFLVGGSLRDWCLGRREFADLDFVVSGDVDEAARTAAERLSARVVVLDERWGVVRLVCPATGPGSQRRTLDFAAMQGRDIREDLLRRDFTCNAMAIQLSCRSGEMPGPVWVDPTGGLEDLLRGALRMVGPGAFREDPLRMLRAFRLEAWLGLRVDEETLASVEEHRERIRLCAGERIREELLRFFASPASHESLLVMDRCGFLEALFPEIGGLRGLPQGSHHHLDAWAHCLETLRLLEVYLREGLAGSLARWNGALEAWLAEEAGTRPLLKVAALLHDAGKADTFERDPAGEVHFYGHARRGAEIADGALARIRASRSERERVRVWVRHHMGPMHMTYALRAGALTERARIRFLRRLGPDAMGVILLALADLGASRGAGRQEAWDRSFQDLVDSLLSLAVARGALSPDLRPPVTGRELMDALGIPGGPRVGRLLRLLVEATIDGRVRDREDALKLARVLQEKLPPG